MHLGESDVLRQDVVMEFHIQDMGRFTFQKVIALFPVQIIEAFFEFIIAAYIYRCSDKLGSKKGLYEYLWLYSLLRFVLEFFRYDVNRGKIGFLSTSQIISLVIAIIVFEKKRKINNYGR